MGQEKTGLGGGEYFSKEGSKRCREPKSKDNINFCHFVDEEIIWHLAVSTSPKIPIAGGIYASVQDWASLQFCEETHHGDFKWFQEVDLLMEQSSATPFVFVAGCI